ncbi:MAG: hypothetical protein PVF83_10215 [Anaerolineales bacterium]|jgi:hypothetical protein
MEKSIEEIKDNLDFSSWFDLWHTHVDWKSEGQDNWSVRKQFLVKLFALYEILNQKMIQHNRIYQSFCIIDLEDSGQDSVYIHTENPNCDNYPLTLEVCGHDIELVHPLQEFIEQQGYKWQALNKSNSIVVYKEGFGERLF